MYRVDSLFGKQNGSAFGSWQTGKSWLGVIGLNVLLATALVALAGSSVDVVAAAVGSAESEAALVGNATSKVVGSPSLMVLTARATVGAEEDDEEVAKRV
jgi:hypothetical protein